MTAITESVDMTTGDGVLDSLRNKMNTIEARIDEISAIKLPYNLSSDVNSSFEEFCTVELISELLKLELIELLIVVLINEPASIGGNIKLGFDIKRTPTKAMTMVRL